MSSKRIGILFGGFALVFCALFARLFQLQIASGSANRSSGASEARTIALPAARGAILDRDARLLRGTRDSFDVQVTASTFREKNLVDALADLSVLIAAPPERPAPLDRSRLVMELRGRRPGPTIASLLELDPRAAIADDADDLHGRARVLIEPEGTLVRPSSYARRRVVDALAVLAGGQGPAPREIRKRLKAGCQTVGKITDATAAELEERIRREEELLSRLGAELRIGDAGEVRSALDELCDRHYKRVEAEVERRIDDAISLQHFGSWSLEVATLGGEELAKLRVQAAAAIRDPVRARAAVVAAHRILSGRLPGPLSKDEIRPGSADDVAAARGAALADWDRATVRASLCGQIRNDPGFSRSRYMDARKESQTRNELAAFRGDELGCGGTFALVGVVEGPNGLRALGFDLVSSFGRDAARAQAGGSLALLLGDLTRRNVPTGSGVEQKLDHVLRGEAGEARIAGDGRVTALRLPRHGTNLPLTLSLPLQQRVEAILDRMGAAAVVDVQTGGILAATTWPLPADGDAGGALAELLDLEAKKKELVARLDAGDDAADPLLASVRERLIASSGYHRAVTSLSNVPPGSVMKALTLLAGLEAGAIRPEFEVECTAATEQRKRFGCHAHGRVDLEGAIERSCNEYCYETVGLLGGAAPLFQLYDRMGLFDEVIGLIGPGAGVYMRNAIRSDDPKNLAIGQGSLSLPAVRLAGIAASLASGRVVRAHFYAPPGFVAIGSEFAQEQNLAVIRSGMRKVAVGENGTARRHKHRLDPLGIAGKTGTAQLRTSDELYAAWFVGYAPHTAPRYAFAVLVDRTHDEEGADVAPIAAKVIEACYEVLGGRP